MESNLYARPLQIMLKLRANFCVRQASSPQIMSCMHVILMMIDITANVIFIRQTEERNKHNGLPHNYYLVSTGFNKVCLHTELLNSHVVDVAL